MRDEQEQGRQARRVQQTRQEAGEVQEAAAAAGASGAAGSAVGIHLCAPVLSGPLYLHGAFLHPGSHSQSGPLRGYPDVG